MAIEKFSRLLCAIKDFFRQWNQATKFSAHIDRNKLRQLKSTCRLTVVPNLRNFQSEYEHCFPVKQETGDGLLSRTTRWKGRN